MSSFKLQYWTGEAWADIPGAYVKHNLEERVSFTFVEPVVADRVRFFTEARDDGFIRVREIAIYGVVCAP